MLVVLKTQQIYESKHLSTNKKLPSLTYFLLVLVSEFLRKKPNSFSINSIKNLMKKKVKTFKQF